VPNFPRLCALVLVGRKSVEQRGFLIGGIYFLIGGIYKRLAHDGTNKNRSPMD
jgi:hypothetical protein